MGSVETTKLSQSEAFLRKSWDMIKGVMLERKGCSGNFSFFLARKDDRYFFFKLRVKMW